MIEIISFFILLILLFFIKNKQFIEYSHTILGKLFVICMVVLCSYIHIGFGIAILCIIISYYKYYQDKSDLYIDTISYLDGIDCIYWINLDRSTDRKMRMEKMLQDPVFTGKPVQRIHAIDGKKYDIYNKIKVVKKQNTNLEYACLLSHLKAIKIFSESKYNTALIFEDDVTLEFKKYWKKSLRKIITDAPDDWEIIQLCYNTTMTLTSEYTLNNYKKNNYGGIACMAAYIINNKAAKKFINDTYDPVIKKYTLLNYHTHEADHYLYKCLRTYTYRYPYFIYPTDNNSTLHPEDLASHIRSKLKLEQMYKDIINKETMHKEKMHKETMHKEWRQ